MTRPSDEYLAPSFEIDSAAATAVAEKPQPLPDLREKPVVVTGAAGFVGTRVCTELVTGGWKVRAVVRDTRKAAQRIGHLALEMRVGDIRDAETMRAAMKDAGSLVHLAAIAIEKSGDDYDSTNTDATRVLIDAARTESVERIVYMSQNGADSRSPYRFLRSKGVAQDVVTESSARWTVLRPSVIFGREDEFVNVLARLVRLSPLLFPLPGGGSARFQPVAVSDVAKAVVQVLEQDSSVRQIYTLGGLTPLTLRQMTERILIAMNASRFLIGVPVGVIRPLVAVLQRVLPNPPVTTSLLDLLAVDNTVDQNELQNQLGIDPVPFAPEELLYLRKITLSSAMRSLFRR
ncbi:MAG TPA: NAD(P)H-binding protein [Gemmatimonadaceae bacterium]|nr:NAD(P)H-binding protein [Gemmatimonadaceae bacterium]